MKALFILAMLAATPALAITKDDLRRMEGEKTSADLMEEAKPMKVETFDVKKPKTVHKVRCPDNKYYIGTRCEYMLDGTYQGVDD